MFRDFVLLGIFLLVLSCTEKNPAVADIGRNDSLSTGTAGAKQSDSVEIPLYVLYDLEENRGVQSGFVSLSDNYWPNAHRDSLAMPAVSTLNATEKKFLVLQKKYRNRFLEQTKISEDDSLYIFDYSAGKVLSFPVKDLNIAANQNIYSEGSEELNQHNYEYGFEVPKNQLNNFSFNSNLVAVGKENPFPATPLIPLEWKKISNLAFPVGISKRQQDEFTNSLLNSAYMSSSEHYRFFVRDFESPEEKNYTVKRHLIVTDLRGKELIQEKIFAEDEGRSIAPLNADGNIQQSGNSLKQWSGTLLKGKPEVIFGFEYVSFGCPAVIFLDSSKKDLVINCDNRH